jgi:hypothetical protein
MISDEEMSPIARTLKRRYKAGAKTLAYVGEYLSAEKITQEEYENIVSET